MIFALILAGLGGAICLFLLVVLLARCIFVRYTTTSLIPTLRKQYLRLWRGRDSWHHR